MLGLLRCESFRLSSEDSIPLNHTLGPPNVLKPVMKYGHIRVTNFSDKKYFKILNLIVDNFIINRLTFREINFFIKIALSF